MNKSKVGTVRASQVITTYGPGALVDLPDCSVIIAGLDTWPSTDVKPPKGLRQIVEPRLTSKVQRMTGIRSPLLYAPPPDDSMPWLRSGSGGSHIGVRRFPKWFVVQGPDTSDNAAGGDSTGTSRRLVHLRELEKERFEGRKVVATRFVRACPNGHVDDLDWWYFVHSGPTGCRQPLWLDERGQSGDLGDLTVRCGCGEERVLSDAVKWDDKPLGRCEGKRPWLKPNAREDCDQWNRLLIRTASNAYFSQVVRVLSIPESDAPVNETVEQHWDILKKVKEVHDLETLGDLVDTVQSVRNKFADQKILQSIQARRTGTADNRPAKQVELDAFLAAPEGSGDDVPVGPDYHARRLPRRKWKQSSLSDGIDAVVQLHRLREVAALVGFTRLDAALPGVDGEYESDVTRAVLDENPSWFPATENRGEGIFLSLSPGLVAEWLGRSGVEKRIESLRTGHSKWLESRRKTEPEFPGGPYVLLHTLAHLLMQALALRCGYPATSIRERIYLDTELHQYGILLYTASPDADGTLGGLVQQARHLEEHLSMALSMAELCSSDPICAQHSPGESLDERWLHGAACHSCCLIAETSCEMRNVYLDRALVVPTVDVSDAAFFERPA